MKAYGLIGYPLTHSFSKQYFESKFQLENIIDSSYSLFELKSINEYPGLLVQTPNLRGLNVTIPYKESILPFLDEIDTEAEKIGAINTIKVNIHNKHTKGFNTDVYGFELSLKKQLEKHHKKALVLGTGGASKAVQYVLHKLGIDCQFVSREKQDSTYSYQDINDEIINSHQLVINTTPLGTYPNTESKPDIPYKLLTSSHLLFDMTYNPALTTFMKLGKEHGAQVINGKEMLVLQAEQAWKIWNIG